MKTESQIYVMHRRWAVEAQQREASKAAAREQLQKVQGWLKEQSRPGAPTGRP